MYTGEVEWKATVTLCVEMFPANPKQNIIQFSYFKSNKVIQAPSAHCCMLQNVNINFNLHDFGLKEGHRLSFLQGNSGELGGNPHCQWESPPWMLSSAHEWMCACGGD